VRAHEGLERTERHDERAEFHCARLPRDLFQASVVLEAKYDIVVVELVEAHCVAARAIRLAERVPNLLPCRGERRVVDAEVGAQLHWGEDVTSMAVPLADKLLRRSE